MGAVGLSETLVNINHIAWRRVPEYSNLNPRELHVKKLRTFQIFQEKFLRKLLGPEADQVAKRIFHDKKV
jgi:hypothetical protein